MYPYILSIYYLGIDHTVKSLHASYGEAVAEWIELVLLWGWDGVAGVYVDQNQEEIRIKIELKDQPIHW